LLRKHLPSFTEQLVRPSLTYLEHNWSTIRLRRVASLPQLHLATLS